MKREGRQHGMVVSYMILPSPLNPRPDTRFVTRFDYPPTAGLFTKVSSKPTNHSKFTGKCRTPCCIGCHLHPSCKSKDKTKGNKKHKYCWVMDQPEYNFVGLSATRMLEHFSNDYMEEDDEMQDEIRDQVDYNVNHSSTLDDGGDWVDNNDDGTCISEIMFDFQMDHVEKYEDEDWCLVESCS